jgi:hypothetical protein
MGYCLMPDLDHSNADGICDNILGVGKNGLYEMTPFTTGLVKEDLSSILDYFFHMGMPASPPTRILKDMKYQNPPGNENDCFKYHSNDRSIWEHLAANLAVAENLGRHMKATGCK